MAYCKTGRHLWTNDEDARRCCNGYRRVLEIGNVSACNVIGSEALPGGYLYGYRWVRHSEAPSHSEE